MVNTRSKTDALKILSGSGEALTKVSGPPSTSGEINRAEPSAEPPADVKEPEKKRRRIAEGESNAPYEPPTRRPDDGTLEALPMDIILEILSYLHPLDLLRLARTSRIFRNLLLSKNSRHTWRAARLALDINTPECPPDQSEPQWARLILDTTCPTCDATESTRVEWGLRVRGCRVCLGETLILGSDVPRAFPGISDIKNILDMLPFAYARTWGWRGQQKPPLSTKRADRQYYRPAIQPMIDIYRSLRKQVLAKAPGAKEQFNTFVAQRKEYVTAIFIEEEQLKLWGDEQVRLREQKVREEIWRWQRIYQQELVALGYHPLDADRAAGETYNIRHEDGWEKNRAFFEAAASRAKGHRIAQERSLIFNTLCQNFLIQTDQKAPIRGLRPSPRDLRDTVPQIEEILQSGDEESYQDELNKVFPTALERWWGSRKEIFVEKIFDSQRQGSPLADLADVVDDLEDGRPDPNQDTPSEEALVPSFASPYAGVSGPARQAILDLAKSVFTCPCQATGWLKNCPLYWDGGLTNHHCPRGKCWSTRVMDFPKIEFDALASGQVDAVCAALGLDANQARFTDLDDLDARFRCVNCPHKSRIMNWRVAIRHQHKRGKISQRLPPTFAKISDEEADIVRAFELANPDRSCPLGRIRSPLCYNAFYTTDELLDYLKAKHDQTELAPDSYWTDPSIPPNPVLETDVFEDD